MLKRVDILTVSIIACQISYTRIKITQGDKCSAIKK